MRRRDIIRSIAISLGFHTALALALIATFQAAPTRPTSPTAALDPIMVTFSGSAPSTTHRERPRRRPPPAQGVERPSSIVQPNIELAAEKLNMDREAVEPAPTSVASDLSSDSALLPQELASQTLDEAVGSPLSTPASNQMDAYRVLVLTALERAKRYPLFARERGIEGTVEIVFVIQPDGRVSDPEVVISSQSRILDDAALGMVSRVGILPPPPEPVPLRFPARIGYRLDSP